MTEFFKFLSHELYRNGDYVLEVQNVIMSIFILLVWITLFQFAKKKWLPRFYETEMDIADEKNKKKAGRLLLSFFLLLGLISIINALELNLQLYPLEPLKEDSYGFFVNTILEALAVLQFARLADWLVSNIIIRNYQNQRKHTLYDRSPAPIKKKPKRKVERTASVLIQSIFYAFAVYFFIRLFNADSLIPDLTFTFGQENKQINITLSKIAMLAMIFFIARFIAWTITQLALFNYYKSKGINIGDQYAVNQLIHYFIFFLAFIIALQSIGLHLTVVWGGIAALLVGVGLGLQQTFNDWASGIILLLERTVEVGDIVEVDAETVGTVRKIGLRVSRIETLENISIFVPNSRLVNEKVINWSHLDNKARFVVKVGVAYGSDAQLVKDVLLEVAHSHNYVMKYPDPFVRFTDFGASSLDFELHIWSQAFRHIEDVKSDIRFLIDQKFREHNIEIPFQQVDIWFKNKEA